MAGLLQGSGVSVTSGYKLNAEWKLNQQDMDRINCGVEPLLHGIALQRFAPLPTTRSVIHLHCQLLCLALPWTQQCCTTACCHSNTLICNMAAFMTTWACSQNAVQTPACIPCSLYSQQRQAPAFVCSRGSMAQGHRRGSGSYRQPEDGHWAAWKQV